MNFNFKGLMAPVFTPFRDDGCGTLNLDVIPEYVEYLIKNDIRGILVNGTSGEGMSMNVKERKILAESWIKAANQRLHVMVQVGGAPLPDVLELAKHAEEIKADSILCLPDLYNKPETSGQLIEYLKLVSEVAANTPLLYYHIPMFTNVNIHMGKFLQEISGNVKNFVGIKFTSNDLVEGFEAVKVNNREFTVFLGADTLMLKAYVMGFDSCIATTLNNYPEIGVEIFRLFRKGKLTEAQRKQEELTTIVNAITKFGSWVATMKVAMNLRGSVDCGPVRVPIVRLRGSEVCEMDEVLRKIRED